MTRINVVPVEELCDEHLRAEYREIIRVPKLIIKREYNLSEIPEKYTVRTEENPSGGAGHVKFFCNKLIYIQKRFGQLEKEMQKRGFLTILAFPKIVILGERFTKFYLNDYNPTEDALSLNRKRIAERMPNNPHYNHRKMNDEQNFSNRK